MAKRIKRIGKKKKEQKRGKTQAFTTFFDGESRCTGKENACIMAIDYRPSDSTRHCRKILFTVTSFLRAFSLQRSRECEGSDARKYENGLDGDSVKSPNEDHRYSGNFVWISSWFRDKSSFVQIDTRNRRFCLSLTSSYIKARLDHMRADQLHLFIFCSARRSLYWAMS